MARDLIPPSSPAGRPAPDGTPNLIELPPEPARAASQPPLPEPSGPSQFRNRFGFLLGALAGILIAAALVGVVVLSTGRERVDDGLAANWSRWQPTDTTALAGATQIAQHVEGEYRDAKGKQITVVRAIPLTETVALRGGSGAINLFEDPGIAYTVDGLGPHKSILGKGTAERLRLVQRQALELALYTFRYLPDVEQVVTYLPPPPPTEAQITAQKNADTAGMLANAAIERARTTGAKKDYVAAQGAIAIAQKAATDTVPDGARRAVFYRPGDLRLQLEKPLGETLPAKRFAQPDNFTADELTTVDELTKFNQFNWSRPDPERAILMLDMP